MWRRLSWGGTGHSVLDSAAPIGRRQSSRAPRLCLAMRRKAASHEAASATAQVDGLQHTAEKSAGLVAEVARERSRLCRVANMRLLSVGGAAVLSAAGALSSDRPI